MSHSLRDLPNEEKPKERLKLNTITKIEFGINQSPTIESLTKLANALEAVGIDDLIN